MSLTVQRPMSIREQGRALFADFPETPNAGYFFSHFQESDGSTVWCRANRTARGGPIYHLVKILNPQNPENREFQEINTAQLNLFERRQFAPLENRIFDREREIEQQEIDRQREEYRRTVADIRQQHATIERQLDTLEQQNVIFEQQNVIFEQQNAIFEQQNAFFRDSNSRKDALIEQVRTNRMPQAAFGTIGQAHITHATSSMQQIAADRINPPNANATLGVSSSALLPSAHGAISSPMNNHLSTPTAASASHPVVNQVRQASVSRNEPSPRSSNSLPVSQSLQQRISEQEDTLASSANATDHSCTDANSYTNQDNDEPSLWQKVQENISFLFVQVFSNIKHGWEYFISLF